MERTIIMDEKDLNPDEREKIIAKLRAKGITGPVSVISKSRTAEDIAASMLERVLDAPVEGIELGEALHDAKTGEPVSVDVSGIIKEIVAGAPDPRVVEFYERIILPGFWNQPLGTPYTSRSGMPNHLTNPELPQPGIDY